MKGKKPDYRKAHVVLRELMADANYTNQDLSRQLNLGTDAVSKRLNGRAEWLKEEMYRILDVFRVPEEYMHIVFPKNIYSKKRLPTKAA